jgi:hypothetical protein
MSARCVSIAFVVLGLGFVACDTGNPPVRAGQSQLEFGTIEERNQHVFRIQRFIGDPFFNWDHREWELVGHATTAPPLGPMDLPNFALQPGGMGWTGPLVRYESNNAYWVSKICGPGQPNCTKSRELWHQHEVDLFGRDPEEFYNLLYGFVGPGDFNNPMFVPRWGAEWGGPTKIPLVPIIAYPPSVNYPTDATPANPLGQPLEAQALRQFFYPLNVPGSGPGAAPFPPGRGSIKTAKVVDKGLCSKFLPYSASGMGLLELVDSKIWPFLATAFCNTTIKKFAHYGPYVHQTTDREDAQYGGFFFNTEVQIQALLGGGPHFLFHSKNDWDLFDGRLTISPQVIFQTGQGSGVDTVMLGLYDKLGHTMNHDIRPTDTPTTFAEGVWQTADALQAFNQNFGCSQEAPGEETITWTPQPNMMQCGGYISFIQGAAATAAASALPDLISLGPQVTQPPAFTAADVQQIKDTVTQPVFEPRLGKNVYKNFRCVVRSGSPVCEYILRAKRLNVYPDGIELVFIDDRREFSNPTYPLWLIAWDAHDPTNPNDTGLFKLCDSPTNLPNPLTVQRLTDQVAKGCTKFSIGGMCVPTAGACPP